MAALNLPTEANYKIHSAFTVDTRDHEDHTFNGIMFDIQTKADLPVKYIQIDALWVRGELGPITVWATPGSYRNKQESKDEWVLLHKKRYKPSRQELHGLYLDVPLQLQPGTTRGIYIHSALRSDKGLVYDNQRHSISHDDKFLSVLPGAAHLSSEPFSGNAWGWGAWRRNREFVGRISYGSVYELWLPTTHLRFPQEFRVGARAMLEVHAFSWSGLPSDVVLYILNMCPYDWFRNEETEETDEAEMAATAGPRALTGTDWVQRRRQLVGMAVNGDADWEEDEGDDDDDDDYEDDDEDEYHFVVQEEDSSDEDEEGNAAALASASASRVALMAQLVAGRVQPPAAMEEDDGEEEKESAADGADGARAAAASGGTRRDSWLKKASA